MKTKLNLLVSLVMLLATLTVGTSWAQIDPAWLASWRIAEQQQPAIITSTGRIAPENQSGTPLAIFGLVTSPEGKPEGGVLVHAYHTDELGLELGDADHPRSTWKYQRWVRTDEDGQFHLQTIRPLPERGGKSGAHVHFTLVSDKYGRQRAPTAFLGDDPLVTDDQRQRSKAFGRFGSVREVRTEFGAQYINVNLRLKELADF